MQDPEVCKLMYPYVPENMRSPDGVQLMMSDPEIRDKLESALQQAFKVDLPSPFCHTAAIAAAGHRPYTWVYIQFTLFSMAGNIHSEH